MNRLGQYLKDKYQHCSDVLVSSLEPIRKREFTLEEELKIKQEEAKLNDLIEDLIAGTLFVEFIFFSPFYPIYSTILSDTKFFDWIANLSFDEFKSIFETHGITFSHHELLELDIAYFSSLKN